MKTLNNFLKVDKNNQEETTKKMRTGRISRYLIYIFMFSWTLIMSSCAVGYHTPGYNEYAVITPEYDNFGVLINPRDYGWRHQHRDWIRQHPHWRKEYPHREHHAGDRH